MPLKTTSLAPMQKGVKQPKKSILAIDPGGSGGFALRSHDGALKCWGMPSDEPSISKELRGLQEANPRVVVYLEQVGGYHRDKASERQTGSHMFSFGRNYGYILGVCETLGWEVVFVAPQTWQAALGVRNTGHKGEEKKRFLKAVAERRFPMMTKEITLKTCDAMLLLSYAEPREKMKA